MRLVEIASRVGNDRSLSRMMKGRREREREREKRRFMVANDLYVVRCTVLFLFLVHLFRGFRFCAFRVGIRFTQPERSLVVMERE